MSLLAPTAISTLESQKMVQHFEQISTSSASSSHIFVIGILSPKTMQHFETRSIWTVKFHSWQHWAFSSVLLVVTNVDPLLKDECKVFWQSRRSSKAPDSCAWSSVTESTVPEMRPSVLEKRSCKSTCRKRAPWGCF